MDAGPHRASRAIEELRLQLAVDRLVADGALPPGTAFDAADGLERELGERGLLGLDLEALRRQARQQRRQARALQRSAILQRYAAAQQWTRALTLLGPDGRLGRRARPAPAARSDRRA
jgi:hypothetical protein